MIHLDTNVVSETLRKRPDPRVMAWLAQHDSESALPTATIAEIAFGIQKIHPAQRATRLEKDLDDWRRHLADRIFGFNEAAALAYGEIMGNASRRGRPTSTLDGVIAAIAKTHGGRLATRNLGDFQTTGLDLISPWES